MSTFRDGCLCLPYDEIKATTAKCKQWDGQKLEIDNDPGLQRTGTFVSYYWLEISTKTCFFQCFIKTKTLIFTTPHKMR
jgi:hypothetical protein